MRFLSGEGQEELAATGAWRHYSCRFIRGWRWTVWKSLWHVCLRAARRTSLCLGLAVWRVFGSWTLTLTWSGPTRTFSSSTKSWGRRGCSCRSVHRSSSWTQLCFQKVQETRGNISNMPLSTLPPAGLHGSFRWQQRKLFVSFFSLQSLCTVCMLSRQQDHDRGFFFAFFFFTDSQFFFLNHILIEIHTSDYWHCWASECWDAAIYWSTFYRAFLTLF